MKRLAIFFMLLLAALPVLAQNTQIDTPDSSQFRGGLARTGAFDSPALHATPTLRWQYPIARPVRMTAAVAQGLVLIGGEDGMLRALEADTGEALWEFASDAPFVSTPAITDNGTLYVGGLDNNVYAFDVATGAERWRYTTGGQIYASPALVDDTLYIGSRDGGLYALDTATGEQQYLFQAQGEIWSSPAYADGNLFFASTQGYVYALSAEGGDLLWETSIGASSRATTALADGMLFIGNADGDLFALEQATGATLAQTRISDATIESSVALYENTVYTVTLDGTLTALDFDVDETSFMPRWSVNIGGPAYSSPSYADGMVYVVTEAGGLLYAFDAETGEELWRYQTGEQGDWRASSPVLIDGVLFVASDSQGLLALEASEG
jgi:eukaryotic-like serine/threonine-protein kinase